MGHETRQYSDQLFCSRCGKSWDVNDPDPPPCIQPKPKKTSEDWLNELRSKIKYKSFK